MPSQYISGTLLPAPDVKVVVFEQRLYTSSEINATCSQDVTGSGVWYPPLTSVAYRQVC